MSKEGQKHFEVSRFREWASKLHVVKRQPIDEPCSEAINTPAHYQKDWKESDKPLLTRRPLISSEGGSKSVSPDLAAMILVDGLREGYEYEIPSLGITFTKENLGEGYSTKLSK